MSSYTYIIELTKKGLNRVVDNAALDYKYIGLGHFDGILITESKKEIKEFEELRIEEKNKDEYVQIFYLIGEKKMENLDEFAFIFITFFYRDDYIELEENEYLFHTTNDARFVIVHLTNELSSYYNRLYSLKGENDFSHTILGLNKNSSISGFTEIAQELSIRLMLKRKSDFYEYLNALKKHYSGKVTAYKKLGNHDVAIIIKEFPIKELKDIYMNKTSEIYLYKKEWYNMLSSPPCSEFHFMDRDFSNFEAENDGEIKLNEYYHLAMQKCNDLKDKLEKYISETNSKNNNNIKKYSSYLFSILNALHEFASGEYSDYLFLQLYRPVQMLLDKFDEDIFQQDDMGEVLNVITGIINGTLGTNLHTYQLPVAPIQANCDHSLLITYYSVLFNKFIKYVRCNELINNDENGKAYDVSIILNRSLEDIIKLQCCFDTNKPSSRILLINLPIEIINEPKIVYPVCMHEMAHYLDFKARNRKAKVNFFALSIIIYFFFYLKTNIEKEAGKAIIDVNELIDSYASMFSDQIAYELEKYEEDQCYYKQFEGELKKIIKEKILANKEIIVSNLLSSWLSNEGKGSNLAHKMKIDVINQVFDEFFYEKETESINEDLYSENLASSLKVLEFVCDEAFSDMIMIKFLDLRLNEYINLIDKLVDNDKITLSYFRFAVVCKCYLVIETWESKDLEGDNLSKNVNKIKTILDISQTDNQCTNDATAERSTEATSPVRNIISYQNIIDNIVSYLIICNKTLNDSLKEEPVGKIKNEFINKYKKISDEKTDIKEKILFILKEISDVRTDSIQK